MQPWKGSVQECKAAERPREHARSPGSNPRQFIVIPTQQRLALAARISGTYCRVAPKRASRVKVSAKLLVAIARWTRSMSLRSGIGSGVPGGGVSERMRQRAWVREAVVRDLVAPRTRPRTFPTHANSAHAGGL
jgi:hypothetical protein